MANPNLVIYNSADDTVITAINYGTGNAGDILPASSGTEYHLWNDKGKVLTSDPALNIKARVRDSDGAEIDPVTVQKWVELKSTTISTGTGGGSKVGYIDDNMSDFMPTGGNSYVTIGDIPYDCYRKLYLRVNLPPGTPLSANTFSIIFDYQDPSAGIATWITGVHGNGVVPTGNKLAVTDSTGADSVVDVASGYSIINDNAQSIYSQSKTLSTGDGTYYVYVTVDGIVSYVSSTTDFPTNALKLSEVVISSGVVSSVTDKRVFIGNVQAGLDAAKTTGPKVGQKYLATDTAKNYDCYTSGAWTELIEGSTEINSVYSSGTFSLNYIPKVTSTGNTLTNSPFRVTTGDVFDLGAHSYGFTEQNIATTTGTANIDWNNGVKAIYTRSSEAGGAVTFTFTAPVKSMDLGLVIKGSTMGSTGDITWPKVYWTTGAPVLSAGVSAIDIIDLYYSTGIAGYLGKASINYSTV